MRDSQAGGGKDFGRVSNCDDELGTLIKCTLPPPQTGKFGHTNDGEPGHVDPADQGCVDSGGLLLDLHVFLMDLCEGAGGSGRLWHALLSSGLACFLIS